MGTNTARLALFKPDGNPTTGDDVDVDDLNDNSDKIDAAAGFTICTSSTRPASPWDGQPIYETDTNLHRSWVEGAWTDITPDATTTVKGKVELATNSEATTGSSTTLAVTPAGLKAAIDAVLQLIFPVGAYYFSDSVSTNPGTLLGFGTWTAVTDRMIIGAGGTYSAGSTGGAATKTLSTSEIPSHDHGIGLVGSQQFPLNSYGAASGWNGNNTGTGSMVTNTAGGGSSFSLLNPYRAAYMWRRTA